MYFNVAGPTDRHLLSIQLIHHLRETFSLTFLNVFDVVHFHLFFTTAYDTRVISYEIGPYRVVFNYKGVPALVVVYLE